VTLAAGGVCSTPILIVTNSINFTGKKFRTWASRQAPPMPPPRATWAASSRPPASP
jgi:hypothetical protein